MEIPRSTESRDFTAQMQSDQREECWMFPSLAWLAGTNRRKNTIYSVVIYAQKNAKSVIICDQKNPTFPLVSSALVKN